MYGVTKAVSVCTSRKTSEKSGKMWVQLRKKTSRSVFLREDEVRLLFGPNDPGGRLVREAARGADAKASAYSTVPRSGRGQQILIDVSRKSAEHLIGRAVGLAGD